MFKTILILFLGLGVGLGVGGFFGLQTGTERAEKAQKEILKVEQESWNSKINECNEQKTKSEEQLKNISAELELNKSRPGYVTSATLKAPEFVPADIEVLKSDKNGDVKLSWTPVLGAKQYVVTVEDAEGKVISTTEVEGETSMYLNRVPHSTTLSEAEYFVRITTVNGLDQAGPQGERKPVHFAKQNFKPSKKHKSKK